MPIIDSNELVLNEVEPNDTVAMAQALPLGFDPGEVTRLFIQGSLTAPAVDSGPVRTINGLENDGSIPLATETGIVAGTNDVVEDPVVFLSGSAPGGVGEDADFYRLSGNAGQMITVFADGSSVDPLAVIWSSDGEYQRHNDDIETGVNTDSYLQFILPEDGDYYVSVHSWQMYIPDPFDFTSVVNLSGEPDDTGSLNPRR